MKNLWVVGIFALATVACAPQASKFSAPSKEASPKVELPSSPLSPFYADPRPPERHDIVLPSGQQEAAIANALVKCESASECPVEVAMMVTRKQDRLNLCTAFMIGADLALTNSHCIPEDLKADGSSCADRIQLFFPAAQGLPATRVGCARVLKASSIAREGDAAFTQNPDFAVLRLSSVPPRPFLSMNRDGLPEGITLRALSVDPVGTDRVEGLLRVKSCATRQGSIAAPSFTHALAPVGVVSSCDIIPGNSGSPAVDSSGRVRAIVHATIPSVVQDNGGVKTKFRAMGLVTNLACTEIPGVASAAAGCAASSTQDELVTRALTGADVSRLDALYEKWMERAPKTVRFKREVSAGEDGSPTLAPQIECVRGDLSSGKLAYAMPFFGFSARLDEDYRVVVVAKTFEEYAVSFEFDARLLAKQHWVHARSRLKSRNSGETTSNDKWVLTLCE